MFEEHKTLCGEKSAQKTSLLKYGGGSIMAGGFSASGPGCPSLTRELELDISNEPSPPPLYTDGSSLSSGFCSSQTSGAQEASLPGCTASPLPPSPPRLRLPQQAPAAQSCHTCCCSSQVQRALSPFSIIFICVLGMKMI